MPALKLRIPKIDRPFYGEGTLSVLAKKKLMEALASLPDRSVPRVPPQSLPSEPAATIWVSDEQQQAIVHLAVAHQIDGAGSAASGLLHAWAREALTAEASDADITPALSSADTTLDRINRALGDATRPAQATYFAGLVAEVLGRKKPHEVVFAEASTGLGKSRAFLSLVLDWLDAHPGEHAVIALPSYAVVLQTLAQWQRIGEVHTLPPHEVLLGMQEFVSVHTLERILNDAAEPLPGAERVRAWIDGGGKAPPDDTLGHPWLARSLMAVTQEQWRMGRESVVDSDVSENDPGMMAYHRQFKHGRDASVIFCTHAMLAVDVRLRIASATKRFSAASDVSPSDAAWVAWNTLAEEERRTSRTWELRNELLREQADADIGRLPPIGLLVVDEAHLLEQAFANTFATGTSMARLVADLRKLHHDDAKTVLKRDIDAVENAWSELRGWAAHRGIDRVTVEDHDELREAIGRVGGVLDAIVGRLGQKASVRREVRKIRAVKLALDIAARAAGERGGMRVQVSWSPSFQWPSINVGRYDVSRELDFLWAVMVADRSVLVSATLFDDISQIGLENMRRTLSVRQNLVRALNPVRPAWLFDPVTLHIVGTTVHADGLPRFRRPVTNDRLDSIDQTERLERWRSDVAAYVQSAYKSAAGGVLVLLTSHAERAELLPRLHGAIPEDCLLTQGDGRTLDSLRMDFLVRVAAGQRPCLIGVGSAWTGLDISGDGLAALTGKPVPASDDNVLTDLIIPTAPLGTNRTLTQEWRRERTGVMAEVGSMAMTFRQGIGRLVRREGLPNNRRIHFLDARIHESKWQSLLRPAVRALSRYTRRREV